MTGEYYNDELVYERDGHSTYIDDSRIVVYGLPDLDGIVLSAKTINADDDWLYFYKVGLFSSNWFAFVPRNKPPERFDLSDFVPRRKNTPLEYNTPPNWFVAYNYYGAPYFATNVNWGSDQLYVKGSLSVAHVPVDAMFFGIVT